MAVYTQVDASEFQVLLEGLGLGALLTLTGVEEGLENSTYFVELAGGQYQHLVLTVLEVDSPQQIAFSVEFMRHLSRSKLPVPTLISDSAGHVIHHLSGKRALLCERLEGAHPAEITVAHCAAIGDFLGAMHVAGANFPSTYENPQGLSWAKNALGNLLDASPENQYLSVSDQTLLREQITRFERIQEQSALPRGPIHADLFRDNTLFVGDTLKAVIDFNSAGVDCFLLDLAIAVNDWAGNTEGVFDQALVEALLNAYQRHRPLTSAEQKSWQDVLCFAAASFWLSRLVTYHLGGVDLLQKANKNPSEYRQKLHTHRMKTLVIPRA